MTGETEKKSKKLNKKALIVTVICIVLSFPLVIHPIATVVIYESIFGMRYEPLSWMEYDVSDYDGLICERSDFQNNDGVTLAGYKYSRDIENAKGLVIISHGLGGGGQNAYIPFIDFFTQNSYLVFTYDATGNGESGGRDVKGLPQGVSDLDCAIRYAKSLDVYKDLPIFLVGHSWGTYAVGCNLALHPDVAGSVMFSGFNKSKEMLLCHSKNYVGPLAHVLLPSVSLYEKIKFGKTADMSVLDGIRSTDADVLIVHGGNDATVPRECGYDIYYEEFSDQDNIEFIMYGQRGHDYIFNSDASKDCRDSLNAAYTAYVEERGEKYSAEIKEEFMEANLDKKLCFELDAELCARILKIFETNE